MPNTLNVCIGHRPFPPAFAHLIDLTLAPVPLPPSPSRVIVIPSEFIGPYGNSLAEYAQLAWLFDHFDEICGGYDYLRIVHYRRFVSRRSLGRPTSAFFATYIGPDELDLAAADFDRTTEVEVVNPRVRFEQGGTLAQYTACHRLEDMLSFAAFLLRQNLLPPAEIARFLEQPVLIPACSTGVYRTATWREIGAVLRRVADFVNDPGFVMHEGYQRRSAGFLLERFNSHLLLEMIRAGSFRPVAGHYTFISDGPEIAPTI